MNQQNDPYHMMETIEENPFRVPTDEEVFMMRDAEKRERHVKRQANANIPVHQKTTWTTRVHINRFYDRELEKQTRDNLKMLHSYNPKFPPIQKEKQEKEHLSQFIEKKKQMFLLTMSLDTKKQEIKKLERKAEEREKKLQAEEQALKRDALRFDLFLTNNDIQAVQAISKAEEETKSKQSKQMEIKKLNGRLNAVKNDIQKLKEQLMKCNTYKKFLDDLTPESWFKQKRDMIEQRRESVSGGRRGGLASSRGSFRKPLSSSSSRPSTAKMTQIMQVGETVKDDTSNKTDDEEEVEMYFKKADQLLARFSILEEENLTLIQSSQEIEEQVEELKKQEREVKEKMYVS
jgi:hypothetical protein